MSILKCCNCFSKSDDEIKSLANSQSISSKENPQSTEMRNIIDNRMSTGSDIRSTIGIPSDFRNSFSSDTSYIDEPRSFPSSSVSNVNSFQLEVQYAPKSGWLYQVEYLTRLKFVPLRKKVFVILHEGCLYCHDQEVNLADVNKNDTVLVVMSLAGVTLQPSITSYGKTFKINITGQSLTLELDAETKEIQNEWFKCILKQIESANIETVLYADDPFNNNGVLDWYLGKIQEKLDAISKLSVGTIFKKHHIKLGTRKEHDRLVKIDEKGILLKWKAVTGSNDDKEVKIEAITEIIEGTGSTVLQSLASDPIRSPCCFTVVTDSRTIDFEAKNEMEKSNWISTLKCIIRINRLEMEVEKKKKIVRPRTVKKFMKQ